MDRKIIFSIIAIIIVGTIVFLSQQAYPRAIGETFIPDIKEHASEYLAKGSNWITSNIYPKIAGEVQKRGDVIKNELNQEKQKVSDDVGKKIENYFSGVANSLAGKNTCTTTAP